MLVIRIGERESENIVLIKAVALQSVDHDGRLQHALEVCEAEVDFLTVGLVAQDQAEGAETWEGAEDV